MKMRRVNMDPFKCSCKFLAFGGQRISQHIVKLQALTSEISAKVILFWGLK
jgi:hypothetical protein